MQPGENLFHRVIENSIQKQDQISYNKCPRYVASEVIIFASDISDTIIKDHDVL